MLFRRVLRHVRRQDWTAVTIDFFIVVVGVYIGIQAHAWNTARENRAIERQYLQSLHDQLRATIKANERRLASFQDRLNAMSEVVEAFERDGDLTSLGPRHCEAIARSHIYVGRIVVPPTIEEMLSTGRLQLVTNDELRLAIVSFSQAIEGMRQLTFDIQSDRAVLSRRHPDLITLRLGDHGDEICDFDAMRRSAAFRNEFADNNYRHSSYVRAIVIGQQDLREQVHALLDRELEISHHDSLD